MYWFGIILCPFQVEPDGEFLVEPLRMLDRREIELRKRVVLQVKVQWKHFTPDEATLEEEKFMQEAYPELFPERGWNTEDSVTSRGKLWHPH